MAVSRVFKLLLPLIMVIPLSVISLMGWSSPPQIYQRFKLEYYCDVGWTMDILQVTADYQGRGGVSGHLNGRAPYDNDIKIAPPLSSITAICQTIWNSSIRVHCEETKLWSLLD